MKEKNPSRTNRTIKKGALALAILAAFLAIVLLLIDVVPITGPEPLSPVLSVFRQIQEKVPYLVFLLSIFALVSVVYYFMLNIARKIENISIPSAQTLTVQEADPAVKRDDDIQDEKTKAFHTNAVDPEAAVSKKDLPKEADMTRQSVEQMLGHLDDEALGGIVERIIERKPDILTPGLLDKMIVNIRKKAVLKEN